MSYQVPYPLARASTVKEDLVLIQIMRESVMDCDPSHMLELLKNITSTREQVVAFEGRVTFYFDGWDDDPREVAEIPEIRAYFTALTEKFLYWIALHREGRRHLHARHAPALQRPLREEVTGRGGLEFRATKST